MNDDEDLIRFNDIAHFSSGAKQVKSNMCDQVTSVFYDNIILVAIILVGFYFRLNEKQQQNDSLSKL